MDKYILKLDKLNQLAQAGASPEDVVTGLDKLKELIIKNEQMKAQMNDPDRLQPFGTQDEPDSKGFGSM